MSEDLLYKQKKLKLLKERQEMELNLPHLYGQKFYRWSRRFFDSTNKYTFLCAANQVGKSSIQIRKVIHWATCPDLWPKLWNTPPLTFWYCYPTLSVATVEFEEKWMPNFMPRGKYEKHPVFGWEAEYARGLIHAIHFNSGVSVYFKSYATDVQNLQTGTLWYIALDEEVPESLFDELNLRLASTDGYFSMAFTATLAQEFWRQTMEEVGNKERFKGACKVHASMYECLEFDDGSVSHWTEERIKRIENSCRSDLEIAKRVHGRFVKETTGLKYHSFERKRHMKTPHPLPSNWAIYSGVDVGSGGDNHPSSIIFVGVSPDYKQARVFRGWRGDNINTTASDVVTKYRDLKGDLNVTGQFYDWASKDFFTISARMGEPFVPAEKSHEIGEQVLNVLFKNDMIFIYDIPELQGLADELEGLTYETRKAHSKDDFIDALRYAVTKIPWDWSAIKSNMIPNVLTKKMITREESDRRGLTFEADDGLDLLVEEELEAWNEMYQV